MARGSAQELFRDNIGSVVDVGVQTLFAENIADMGIGLDPALSAHDLGAANSPTRIAEARAAANAIENHDGIISGSREGVRSGVAERLVDARDGKAAVSQREAERANDTAFYLGLMNDLNDIDARIRALDEQIDHLSDIRDRLASGEIDVDEASRDEEVRAAISEWEERTGRTFNPNSEEAREILTSILDGAISDREALRSVEEANRRDLLERVEAAETEHEEAGVVGQISAERATNAILASDAADSDAAIEISTDNEDRFRDNDFGATASAAPVQGGLTGVGLGDLDGRLMGAFAAANAPDTPSEEPTQFASADPEDTPQFNSDDFNPVG